MTFLTRLELSNFRRFGPKTVLEFPAEPGAVILVAPNGTGKTSIFEAIELALTGAVRRLGKASAAALVRDGNPQAEVCAFYGESRILVSITRRDASESIHVEGDPVAILGANAKRDLATLLRLTHLMDQSERNWFVGCSPEEGGEALAALPAVRDTLAASVAMSSTKRALTTGVNEVRAVAKSAKARLDDWLQRVEERNAAREHIEFDAPLTALAVLRGELVTLATQFWDDRVLGGMGESPPALQAVARELSDRLNAIENELNKKRAFLDPLDDWVDRYSVIANEESNARVALDALRMSRDEWLATREDAKEALRVADKKLSQCQREAIVARLRYDALALKRAHGQAAANVRAAEERLSVAEDRLAETERTLSRLRHMHGREVELKRSRIELDDARKALAQWTASEIEREELVHRILLARQALEGATLLVAERVDVYRERTALVERLREELTQIKLSADTLRAAVATVASQLSPSDGTCPVCLWPHGTTELHRRVQQALLVLSPAIAAAQARLSDAEEHQKAASDALRDSEQDQAAASATLDELRRKDHALSATIKAAREHPLLVRLERALAEKTLELHAAKLNNEANVLEKERSGTPDESGVRASWTALAEERDLVREMLARAQFALAESRVQLAQALDRVGELGIDPNTDVLVDESELARNVVTAEQAVVTARAEKANRERLLADAVAALARVEQELADRNATVAVLADQLREAISTWRANHLKGVPSAAGLEMARLDLNRATAEAVVARKRLNATSFQIARWVSAERLKDLEARVAELCANGEDERDCGERLRREQERVEQNARDAEAIARALDELDLSLRRRLESFRASVVRPIMPVQQMLLRRMVRDQRFSNTRVSFKQLYNKQYAETQVPLHGAEVPVRLIASEAQRTEIQLSFLLALALNHRWCDWRALLLDDPTQHHDLIHASAVFDVLRDFVFDHGFQVIFATHDAGQARFFERKLRNDGLPTCVYTLRPGQDGVVARRG
ncbi:AAA family ATPase [Sorangium sp. So ce513]|uniref:AAA family ATPase n=1 Tax=Sorangium sp. So ce513 TaxID=3133315 RepID=UPI003F5D75E9